MMNRDELIKRKNEIIEARNKMKAEMDEMRSALQAIDLELWKVNCETRNQDVNEERDLAIYQSRKEGQTYAVIAKKFGMSQQNVKRICDKKTEKEGRLKGTQTLKVFQAD